MDDLPEVQLPVNEEAKHEGPVPLVQKAATLLQEALTKLPLISKELADKFGTNRKVLARAVHAVAELSLQRQHRLCEDALAFAVANPKLIPVLLTRKVAYDETQMLLRVKYAGSASADTETTKVFVLENAWSALFQHTDTGKYLQLQGSFSPMLRCSNQSTTAVTLDILNTTYEPATSVVKHFKVYLRLAETDANRANLRVERAVVKNANDKLAQEGAEETTSMTLLHVLCCAHKIHTAAQRCWELDQQMVSGLTRVLLLLGSAGAMRKISLALERVVRERLDIKPLQALDEDAVAYRNQMMTWMQLPASQPKKRATLEAVAKHILNGDWRQPRLQHLCSGQYCCISHATAVAKVRLGAEKVLRALRTNLFAKNDWKSWASSWRVIVMGTAIHNLLPHVFLEVFENHSHEGGEDAEEAHEQGPDNDQHFDENLQGAGNQAEDLLGGDDHTFFHHDHERAVSRQQHRLRLKSALSFMREPSSWFSKLLVMRISLQPQIDLMAKILHTSSIAYKHEQLSQYSRGEVVTTMLEEAVQGTLVTPALTLWADILVSKILWPQLNMPETEAFRATVLRFGARPSSLVWSKIQWPFQHLPWKIFTLLQRPTEALCQELLRLPACMRDHFTCQILEKYSSVALLQSDELKQVLASVACMTSLSTFHTECLHSRNLRRARKRVSVQRASLGNAGPGYLREVVMPAKEERAPQKRGRPPKRPPAASQQEESSTGKGTKRDAAGKPRAAGAWKVFLQQRMTGSWTMNDMRRWQAEYNSMSQEEKHTLTYLGREGRSGNRGALTRQR